MENFLEFMSRDRKEDSENKDSIKEDVNSELVNESTDDDINPEPQVESITPIVAEAIAGYKIFRDKTETFVCDMEISGANPLNSKARVIIESQDMTYMFEGTIDDKGHCEIPLKKMNFLSENEIGKIKLEVIADDMMFNPWEDTFVAVNSKKVVVKIAESVNNTPKVGVRISNIR
jgi:hypothetical protein